MGDRTEAFVHVILAEIVGISVAFAVPGVVFARCYAGRGLIRRNDLLPPAEWNCFLRNTIVRSGLAPLALLFVLDVSCYTGGTTGEGTGRARGEASWTECCTGDCESFDCGVGVSRVGLSLVTGGGVCCGGAVLQVWVMPAMMVMCLAAMVEATADTVSSEIGQAFGGRPVMLYAAAGGPGYGWGSDSCLGRLQEYCRCARCGCGWHGRCIWVSAIALIALGAGFADYSSTAFWERLWSGEAGWEMIW